jgi:hypothetical protein
MDGGQILHSYTKVWVILLLLSATLRNSKLAAKNTEQDKIRKLAAENSGTSASFKTRILVHQVVVILICAKYVFCLVSPSQLLTPCMVKKNA